MIAAQRPALIALDWGTSSLRAYLIGSDGAILEKIRSRAGILQVSDGGFPAMYRKTCGAWLDAHGDLPAIASGMIGSRQGWREAPYVPAPATLETVTAGLISVDAGGCRLHIVPGIVCESASGNLEVMRGEETQILGALVGDAEPATFLLPGTHSKWVRVESGAIASFSTFMTGELYGILRQHSILGKLMHDDDVALPDEWFERGVRLSQEHGNGGLLNHLFSVRTAGLFERVPPSSLASYMSGILLGAEIGEALTGKQFTDIAKRAVSIIGDDVLALLYGSALAQYGIPCHALPADTAVNGLWKIAGAAYLTGQA